MHNCSRLPAPGLEVQDSAQPNPRAQAGALGLNGAESAEASIPGVRIWGPVPEAQAIGAGALADYGNRMPSGSRSY